MTTAHPLERELNPPQLDAVLTTDGPLLVFAGAGSGKTRVITYRASHIVSGLGVAPYQVMCVTFTNKAAGEMRERCAKLLDASAARELWVSTFHSTGARLLRRFHEQAGLARDFAIYDDGDQRTVMSRVFSDLSIDDSALNPRAALGMIDRFKQEVLSPHTVEQRAKTEHEKRVAAVYSEYEKRLGANNAVDFGDLLKKLAELLESNDTVREQLQRRFQYLMVDEFQDTNAAQYRIVRSLVGEKRNICVVGDDDQAIYHWRGADARNLSYFMEDFPDAKIIKLEQNYRSTGRILKAANAVIQHLHQRQSKVLFTKNPDGNLIELISNRDEHAEAQQVASRIKAARQRGAALSNHAVFYRIHAQSRPLEEAMRAANLPYVVIGGIRFYERAEIKDMLAYLRMMLHPEDDVSFLRVVNQPARGIGKTTLDRLAVHAHAKQTSLWGVISSEEIPADLGPARKRLFDFRTLIMDLQQQAQTMLDRPQDLASLILDRTGYLEMLQNDRSPESESRQENLQELLGSMGEYTKNQDDPSVSGYLERLMLDDLRTDDGEESDDKVALLTVHSAKGLEFDTVFVTGLEEGMFPYKGVGPGADDEELEEERRLAYVAITRARKQLVLTFATFRTLFGASRPNPPSRFLREIPREVLGQQIQPVFSATTRMPSKPPPADGIRVEYDEPEQHEQLGGSFRSGMRVKHPKFGMGTVKSVEPGPELKLNVYFPGLGELKKVLAEFIRPV